MANVKKELTKSEKKVRRLYALVWLLACPLAYVVAYLLGFHQINIVYWTLLIVPILLAVYNVRQVPPARKKAVAHAPVSMGDTGSAEADAADFAAQEISTAEDAAHEEAGAEPTAPEGISHVKRAQLITLALKVPVAIATPILITLVVDIIIRLQRV